MSAQAQPENRKTVRLDPEVLAAEFRSLAQLREHWLDKKQLIEHYGIGKEGRSVDTAVKEGMPHAIIFGRLKFRLSQTDPWLEEHGYLERRGEWGYDGPTSNIAPAAHVARTPRGRTSEVPDAS